MLVVHNPPPRHWWLVGAVCWADCLLHTSAGIPYPPGALPFFRPAIALDISSMVGKSSRLVLVTRCGMMSRASWSMSPGMLSSLWKCSLHLAHNSLAVREGLHSICWLRVNWLLLLWSPHFSPVYNPSFCFCRQLSAVSLPSFLTCPTSVHGCIIVTVCRHHCMPQWWI